MKKTYLLLSLIFSLSLVHAEKKAEPVTEVSRGWSSIVVRSRAPFPPDITNETQVKALSREAAITQAQSALLTDVLSLVTNSGRPLSVAEVPSLELQGQIRSIVKNARIKSSTWTKEQCLVVLELDKKALKPFLKKN